MAQEVDQLDVSTWQSGLERHPSHSPWRAYLGLPEHRVGRQGSGGDEGRTRSLLEGWEHSLRRTGRRSIRGSEGPADVNVLTRWPPPGIVLQGQSKSHGVVGLTTPWEGAVLTPHAFPREGVSRYLPKLQNWSRSAPPTQSGIAGLISTGILNTLINSSINRHRAPGQVPTSMTTQTRS